MGVALFGLVAWSRKNTRLRASKGLASYARENALTKASLDRIFFNATGNRARHHSVVELPHKSVFAGMSGAVADLTLQYADLRSALPPVRHLIVGC